MSNAKAASCSSLLQRMVGYDTVNSAISQRPDAERQLSLFLERVAQEMGLKTQRLPVQGDSFNLLVSHQVAVAAKWLLFESHLDTVSAAGMTVDPFAGAIAHGRIYGRGVCDTKGSGAAMLWALSQYRDAGGPNNVALLYTVDEEIGKSGVRAFTTIQLADLGWRLAGAVVGEPTDLHPVVAHNGVVRWRIRTTGVAAHSSDPGKGRSAIAMMLPVIEALQSDYIDRLRASHPLTGPAQCSINLIRGGVQINIIPEHCEIHVDRRLVPGEDPAMVQPAVEGILAALRAADAGIQVAQEAPDMTDLPLDPTGGESFAAHVCGVLADMDLPSMPTGVRYGTDASSLSSVGVPAVVLGPGNIDQAHTKDEWLDLAALDRCVVVYRRLMGQIV